MGSIGVMNIMLVSVLERQQEIGIRIAVGAKPRDIMLLFLAQSICLSFLGGLLGVMLGLLATWVVAYVSHWSFILYFGPIILGLVVAVGFGICSGIYPAIRAARLDPIKSLHYV